jgi:hypothetical protein
MAAVMTAAQDLTSMSANSEQIALSEDALPACMFTVSLVVGWE